MESLNRNASTPHNRNQRQDAAVNRTRHFTIAASTKSSRFRLDEFGKWKPNDRTALIASLQNKFGAFLTNEQLQRALGDRKSKLDLRQVMNNGKVLIVNLCKFVLEKTHPTCSARSSSRHYNSPP